MGTLPVEPMPHEFKSVGIYCMAVVDGQPCNQRKEAKVHELLKDDPKTYYDTLAGRIRLDSPPTTPQEFVMWFDQCMQLMSDKSLAYGDAWRRQGYMGNLARLMSKADRLRNMLWTSNGSWSPRGQESIEDTLRDLCNLAVFMWLNYRDGNQWGR